MPRSSGGGRSRIERRKLGRRGRPAARGRRASCGHTPNDVSATLGAAHTKRSAAGATTHDMPEFGSWMTGCNRLCSSPSAAQCARIMLEGAAAPAARQPPVDRACGGHRLARWRRWTNRRRCRREGGQHPQRCWQHCSRAPPDDHLPHRRAPRAARPTCTPAAAPAAPS
jgi:hypothetical protein